MRPETAVTLTRRVSKGDLLFAQGDSASAAYIVMRGKFRLYIGVDGRESVPLFQQGSGTVLGLPEALLGSSYQTSARAVVNSTVHAISRGDLLGLLKAADGRVPVLSLLTEKLGQIYDVLRQGRWKRNRGAASRLMAGVDLGLRESNPTIH